MSLLRNNFARSEQWRLEWGLRNCISVAFVAFLYLYGPTKGRLTRYGAASTSFATVVTSFVKDVTLGATLTNAWSCLLGAFISSFLAWVYFMIVRTQYEDSVPLLVTLLAIFCFVFVLQYLEMVPVTKKFAVGMIPLNFIGYRNHPDPSFFVWGLFLAVVIGCGCALVGCIVPLPIRFASTELRDRIEYYSEAMASVVKELSQSWLNTYRDPVKSHSLGEIKVLRTRSDSKLPRATTHSFSSSPSASPQRYLNKKFLSEPELHHHSVSAHGHVEMDLNAAELIESQENRHWRKLRLLVTTIAMFRARADIPNHNPMHKFNTRFIRMELVNYLRESLPYLQSRNLETGFGFTRRIGNRCSKYVKLIQDFLLIVSRIEGHVGNMEKLLKYHYLYIAFLSRPNIKYGLSIYAENIAKTLLTISRVLEVQSVLDDQLLTPGDMGFCAVQMAARLIRSRDYFDQEYLRARRDIFYPQVAATNPSTRSHSPKESHPLSHTNNTNTNTDGNTITNQPAQSGEGRDAPILPLHSDRSSITSVPSVTSHKSAKFLRDGKHAGLRVHTKAMLEINSIIFLLDTMSRLVLEFWSHDDLVAMSQHHTLNVRPLVEQDDTFSNSSSEHGTFKEIIPTRNVEKFFAGAKKFVWELFPTIQAHLFCFNGAPGQRWVYTMTIQRRLVMAAKVATAMSIAAFYGIIAQRQSPSLSSLTIAFLAGGAVSGINVMTCINRAAGTAVASVYAIMVVFIVGQWHSRVLTQLFVGFAVVLMQLPSTYVRSYPLYSYSGTVTGFTVALLLLGRSISTEYAVNRIIDTYVGVGLFLVIELGLAATFTEHELISDMKQVFSGLQDRFINFHRNFQFFKAAEDSCAEVQSRIRGGTLTATQVEIELQRIELLRSDIQNRKALEVDSIQALISRQLQLGPFYRSEPSVLRPVMFPTSLLEESIALQLQAVNSIQIMIWAVKTCDGSFDDKVEKMIHRLDRKIRKSDMSATQFIAKCDADISGSESGYAFSVYKHTTYNHIDSNQNCNTPRPAISILPEFKSLLLPLEPHFIEVERFVSAVLVFLIAAMELIADWKPALRAFREPVEIPCLTAVQRLCERTSASDQPRHNGTMLSRLSRVAVARYTSQMAQVNGSFPHSVYERLAHGKDDVFITAEADELYLNYKNLVEGLQSRLAEEGEGMVGPESPPGRPKENNAGRIASNREILIVNSLLTSTQQLIAALHGLTSVVNRMQAHRDIHVTQDGKRL